MTEPSSFVVDGENWGQKNPTPSWVSSSSSPCSRLWVLQIDNSFMSVSHTKLGIIAAYLQNNQSKRCELYFNISSITIISEGMWVWLSKDPPIFFIYLTSINSGIWKPIYCRVHWFHMWPASISSLGQQGVFSKIPTLGICEFWAQFKNIDLSFN